MVWFRRNFVKMFDAGKTRMIGQLYGEKNCDDRLNRFHLIPERYGHNTTFSKASSWYHIILYIFHVLNGWINTVTYHRLNLDIGQLNWCLKDIYPVKAELCDICCLSVILSAISHECVYGCWPKYGRCEQRDGLLEANKFWCWSGSRCRSRISLSLSLTLGDGYFTTYRHSPESGNNHVFLQDTGGVYCLQKFSVHCIVKHMQEHKMSCI